MGWEIKMEKNEWTKSWMITYGIYELIIPTKHNNVVLAIRKEEQYIPLTLENKIFFRTYKTLLPAIRDLYSK